MGHYLLLGSFLIVGLFATECLTARNLTHFIANVKDRPWRKNLYFLVKCCIITSPCTGITDCTGPFNLPITNNKDIVMGIEDFFRAGVNHLLWRNKLEDFVKEGKSIDKNEIISYRDCGVGKWFYSDEMIKYQGLPEVQEFEEIHVKMHEIIANIIELKETGQVEAAKQELCKMNSLSDSMLVLLNIMEDSIGQ